MYENPLDPRFIPSNSVRFSQAGPLGVILAFTRKINLLVLGPVLAITAAGIMGMTDSGFAGQLFDFLTTTLSGLEGSAYRCTKLLPDITAYVECF